MISVKEIKKVRWEYLVDRKEALLFRSFTDKGYKYFKKVTQIPWQSTQSICLEGCLFYGADELDELRSIFLKENIKLFSNFKKRLIFHIKSFDSVARKIEKIGCSKLTKTQLTKLFDDYAKAALYAHNFLVPMPVAGDVISKMILGFLPNASVEKKQEWLGILSYPLKENEHTKEERAFYKIALAYKNIDKLIESHLKEFAWIGARCYWLKNAWTKDIIKDRLTNFFSQNKDPNKEIKHLNSIKKERKKATDDLLKELNIKKPLFHKLVLFAKDFAYTRTWRTDIIYGSGYRARGLFYEIAKRAGLNKEDVVYLTFEEVLKMAQTEKIPISSKELQKRKEFMGTVLLNNHYFVLSGKEWERKLDSMINPKIKTKKEIIKGNVAFAGKVKGIAKIVLSANDIKKVKQGDILVASMTFPNFVPAMEKALAFVTDEGGILCHAAIVSREMRKPCIIGTKNATKILKDGDLVEVDADRGIVRKIK